VIFPNIILDSSKVGCLCFFPWVNHNAFLILSLFVGYEDILNNLLMMSARVEGMRSPFVLSVLPEPFCRQLFHHDFVDVVVVVVISIVAAAIGVAWRI